VTALRCFQLEAETKGQRERHRAGSLLRPGPVESDLTPFSLGRLGSFQVPPGPSVQILPSLM
jgi:hypothetical protein